MPSTENIASHALGLHKLGVNIAQTLGRQFFSVFLGFVTSITIARILGPSGNGQFALAQFLPTLLITILNLGIGSANIYFVGSHSASPRLAAHASFRIWIVLSLLGSAAGALLIGFYGDQLIPGVLPSVLWLAMFAFPLGLLQSYLLSLLQGMQDFRRFNLAILVSPIVMLGLALFFLLLGGGVIAIVIASVIAQAINLAMTLILIRTDLANVDSLPSHDVSEYARQALKYGYKAHLSNILAFINYRADLFLVNLMIDPAAAGVYIISVSVSEQLWVLSQAVGTVILPRLSELNTEETIRNELTPLVARWVLIVTAAGAIFLALVSTFLIPKFFGEAYLDAVTPLMLLLPGIVLGSLSRVLANDLAGRGRPDLNMYTALIIVIANIVGNLLLIPRMGLSGAALATTIAYSLNCVARLWTYSWLSGHRWYVHFMFNAYDAQIVSRGKRLFFEILK